MIRESEIANFLDLIKHITQARNFKSVNSSPKAKKQHRYHEQQQQYNSLHSSKQRKYTGITQENNESSVNTKTLTQYEHKMLKISHQVKKKPRSFKIDTVSHEIQISESDQDQRNKIKNNLYQKYCQMIQKKRHERINKIFRNSQHQLNSNICNISDNIHFENKNKHVDKSQKQSPFTKSKTLKPGLQSIRLKRTFKEKSKKKIQPDQLNIEKFKMPKLQNVNSLSFKRSHAKYQKYQKSFSKKKVPINKIGDLQGWAQEDQKTYFNLDYF